METQNLILRAVAITIASSTLGFAQQPAPKPPPPPMSFFVTGSSKGDGANYGGLAGADQFCQMSAAAAGAGDRTWHAYMSTQGPNAVNARDRIGQGPWYNAKGQLIAKNLSALQGDTLEEALLGATVNKVTAIDEKGMPIKGYGDTPNEHDILTGSRTDGRAYTDGMDHTCNNYTSDNTGIVQVGHFDRAGLSGASWISAHPSQGCSQADLVKTGGAGKLYCFAIDAPKK